MATVFLGRDADLGSSDAPEVAIKVVHAHLRADETSVELVKREAELAARIRHPNVVPVLEIGEDPSGLYLVLEYVEGDNLLALMREVKARGERLPLPIAARILTDALRGLHAAHELTDDNGRSLELVHRDFSPQNILVGTDGVSRLADFSVAKASDSAVHTRDGLVKGKIGYMSPEQARGHDVDRRCDVWAAGVVAWELLAWRRLHPTSDAVSTLLRIVTEPPLSLGAVAPEVPEVLRDAVSRALAPALEERTASARDFGGELEAAFEATSGIASQEEVAAFVRTVFRQKLEDRRQQIAEKRRESYPPESQERTSISARRALPARASTAPTLRSSRRERARSARPPGV
jgi:serine/threonine-protein kinase